MQNSIQEYIREENGRRILDMKYSGKDKEKNTGDQSVRHDGYRNMLNKYGTTQDSSTAYTYAAEDIVPDMDLTDQYVGNGLFAKIIDAPAEEAVKHGYDFRLNDPDVEEFIADELDRLDWEEIAATAIKWTRLYGGAIIVMLVDDGCALDEPIDWDSVEEIEELRVYERAVVEPDRASLYSYNPEKIRRRGSRFQRPEFYTVNSQFGQFRVHESRCLVFQNGKLPETGIYSAYLFFGIPEFLRIQTALRETVVTHSLGPKLLERCVQAVYKMQDLANTLNTDEGEETVLRRLEVIDLARSILNTLVIDKDGEDYDFKSMSLAGVKDIVDSACNMLSAVTNIPQTILFGRSPAGENSTGESDMENYYNYVNKIQKMMLKKNMRILLDLIFECGRKNGEIKGIPNYKVEFVPLWSLSEKEQAEVDSVRAATEQTKAATAQTYIDMQVLDPSEVRAGLKKSEEYTINDLLNEEDDLDIAKLLGIDMPGDANETVTEKAQNNAPYAVGNKISTMEEIKNPYPHNSITGVHKDGSQVQNGVGIIVARGDRILVGRRKDGTGICGPGGHIEAGENGEQAAIREAMEEFNIIPENLIMIGRCNVFGKEIRYSSAIYFTDEFIGEPEADGKEMTDAQWMSLHELRRKKLFPPFKASLDILVEKMGFPEKQTADSS